MKHRTPLRQGARWGVVVTALTVLLFAAATQVAQAQDLKVFFGNLHSHTSYSDGSGKPNDAYKHAKRRASNLDGGVILSKLEHPSDQDREVES